MPRLRLEHISRRFASGGGVSDVTLDLAAGSHLVLVGPSGAGKTTLLRLIAGLEPSDNGRICFDEQPVNHLPPHARHVSFVAQRPALYPHLDVLHNLTIGLQLRLGWWRRPDAEAMNRAKETASWLGLTALLNRTVSSLSGGEQQRVVLGRIAVSQHPIWLLDEPLAHLDPVTRDEVRWQLHLLRDRLGPTIIEVTHDPSDATAGQHVAVLLDGRMAQVGPPAEVLARPNSRGVATSLGWPPMNFIDGPAAPNAGAGETNCAVIGVWPKDVALGPADAGALDLCEWQLVSVNSIGPKPLWTLVRQDVRLRRWADGNDQAHERVQLHARLEHLHYFDAVTGERCGN